MWLSLIFPNVIYNWLLYICVWLSFSSLIRIEFLGLHDFSWDINLLSESFFLFQLPWKSWQRVEELRKEHQILNNMSLLRFLLAKTILLGHHMTMTYKKWKWQILRLHHRNKVMCKYIMLNIDFNLYIFIVYYFIFSIVSGPPKRKGRGNVKGKQGYKMDFEIYLNRYIYYIFWRIQHV